jgi:hypothetical protein
MIVTRGVKRGARSAELVGWQAGAIWLSHKTGRRYRLPTDEE